MKYNVKFEASIIVDDMVIEVDKFDEDEMLELASEKFFKNVKFGSNVCVEIEPISLDNWNKIDD